MGVEHFLGGKNFCQNIGGSLHSQIAHQIHRNIPPLALLEHPGQRRLSNFARAQHDNSALLRRKAPRAQFGSIRNKSSYPEERGKHEGPKWSWCSVDVIAEMSLIMSHIADLFTCSVSPEGGNICGPRGVPRLWAPAIYLDTFEPGRQDSSLLPSFHHTPPSAPKYFLAPHDFR